MDHITVSDIPLPGEEFVFKPSPVINEAPTLEEEVVVADAAENETKDFLQDVVQADEVELITETVEALQMEVEQAATVESDTVTLVMETSQQLDESIEPLVLEEESLIEEDSAVVEETVTIEDSIVPEETKVEEIAAEISKEEPVEIVQVEETVAIVQDEEPIPIVEEPTTVQEHIENKSQPAKKSTRTNSTIEAIKNDWSDGLTIEEINEESTDSSTLTKPESVPIITEPDKSEETVEITEEEKPAELVDTSKTVEEEVKQIIETVEEEVKEVVETVEEEVKQVVETVEEEVKQVVETVEEAVKQVVETVEEAVKQVVEIVEEDKEEEEEEVKKVVEEEVKQLIKSVDEDVKQVVVETVEEKTEDTSANVEHVVVLETEHEEILGTVAENVTIEIIDNNVNNTVVMETSTVVEEQPPPPVVPADKQSAVKKIKCEDTNIKDEKKETEPDYVMEEVGNNNKTDEKETHKSDEPPVVKRGRGRPPKASQRPPGELQIPCHVLGRNVDNPTEDLISNGRTPPKPRLGVKVPYRFLTSQIVTKEEIANELIELTNKRNPTPDPPAGGDVFFASKLTQRLASKIALNANNKKPKTSADTSIPKSDEKTIESSSGIPSEELTTPESTDPLLPTVASGSKSTKNTIENNSDLLAILEGDDVVDWTKEVRKTSEAAETKVVGVVTTTQRKAETPPGKQVTVVGGKVMDPEVEKQMALKQLREMPKKDGRGRPRKYHHLYEPKMVKTIVVPPEAVKKVVAVKSIPETLSTDAKNATSGETSENLKLAVNKITEKIKENKNQNTKEEKTKNDKLPDPDSDLNLTPRRVTKTYSRKEAVLDVPAELEYIVNEPEANSALPETSGDNKDATKTSDDKTTAKQLPDNKKQKTTTVQQLKKQKRAAAEINKPEVTLVSKRARIIKKKVIWDPAEVPKTKVLNAIRRAQELEMNKRKYIKNKDEEEEDTSEKDEEDEEEEQTEKVKEQAQKREESNRENLRARLRKTKLMPRTNLNKVQKKKFLMKRSLRSLSAKLIRSSNGELKSSLALTKKKKQVMAAIAKNVNKPKKTELDKLLGDEGAVNMLYSVRQGKSRGKKVAISKKELLNRKKVLRDVITQSSNTEDTTKALRKKESPVPPPIIIPPRKKSRDSVRSSLQSPPPSPSFYHPQRAEASRIIRRHSSSFSSECSSPRRLSIDQSQQSEDKNNTSVRILRRKEIILDKKDEDKNQKKEEKTDRLSQAEKRKLNVEMSKNFDKTPKKRTRSSKTEEDSVKEEKSETKGKMKELTQDKSKGGKFTNVQTEYKEILLKKHNNFYQIIMTSPANAKLKDVISLQMFRELNLVLTKLAKDDNCKVVALTSTGKSFCNGLDFSNLIQTTAEKRATAAAEMAKTLKEFVLKVAKFPKTLVSALHSSASLLGCTMLPYFDIVLASETATLSADYCRMGHSPEGGVGLGLSSTLGPKRARDLLMFGKKMTATEAMDCGLVKKVEKKEKLEEEMIKMGVEISEKSQQSLLGTKTLLQQPVLQKLEEALELEGKLLMEQWISAECQQNFKKLLQEEEVW